MLAFAVVAEVLAVALVMFGMRYLLEVFGVAYVAVYGTIFVFFMGFFAAFAAYKIYKEYTPDRDVHVDDGVMSGFAEYGHSQQQPHHLHHQCRRRHRQPGLVLRTTDYQDRLIVSQIYLVISPFSHRNI